MPDIGPLLARMGVTLPLTRVTGDLMAVYVAGSGSVGPQTIRIPADSALLPDRLSGLAC
jgi:hypothetical protein